MPSGSAGTWVQSGAVRYFDRQTIFQEMDGAGDAYNAYGFRQLAKTDYRRSGGDLAVTAEVYDMGSPLGAFGRFSMLLSDSRDPATMEARAIPLGNGGFLGTSQAVFWKGSYLVQLNLEDEGGTRDESSLASLAHESLLPMATRIASLIPENPTQPAPPTALPGEGLVWGGRTYLPDGALDEEHTGPAWVGHYRSADNQRYRIAVLVRATIVEAHGAFSAFHSGRVTAIPAIGDEAAAVEGTHGEILVARKGLIVAAVADPSPSGPAALSHEAKLDRLRALVASLP